MFGPVRGSWPGRRLEGLMGRAAPYHTDVFMLTHHARAPIARHVNTPAASHVVLTKS